MGEDDGCEVVPVLGDHIDITGALFVFVHLIILCSLLSPLILRKLPHAVPQITLLAIFLG